MSRGKSKNSDKAREAMSNLEAFRPDWERKCEVCSQTPVVNVTGLCGPCTWGEANTANGEWWDDEDERRYQSEQKADGNG